MKLTETIELEDDLDFQDKFAQANPNPVLSSAMDGELNSVNVATLNLMKELGLKQVTDLLPGNHIGLVKACQKTRTTLTSEKKLFGRNIIWSYQSIDDSDIIYIYGYDISKYNSQKTVENILPTLNPSPVILSTLEGVCEFSNPAVSDLLEELKLKNVADILPNNHHGLLKAASKTQVLLTEERSIGNKIIAWTYKLAEDNGDICIYGYDISHYTTKIFSIEGMPRSSDYPVVSTDIGGVPKYINYATSIIVDELGFNGVEDILPKRHNSLVRACLATKTPLREEYQVYNRSIYWSYHPVEGSNFIYISGRDMA